MNDLISMREYAELHGLPLETVKTRVKHNQIPVVRFGKSVMIDRNTPWEVRKKTGRKSKEDKIREEIESRMNGNELKVRITRAYYVSVEDASGKEICSDFTFLNKDEAKKLGERMKKAKEGEKNGNG